MNTSVSMNLSVSLSSSMNRYMNISMSMSLLMSAERNKNLNMRASHQFGFQQRHLTIDQVHPITTQITMAPEQKCFYSAIFLNITGLRSSVAWGPPCQILEQPATEIPLTPAVVPDRSYCYTWTLLERGDLSRKEKKDREGPTEIRLFR